MAERTTVFEKPFTRSEWGKVSHDLTRGRFDGRQTRDIVEKVNATIENGGFAEEVATWDDVHKHFGTKSFERIRLERLMRKARDIGLFASVQTPTPKDTWKVHVGARRLEVAHMDHVKAVIAAVVYGVDGNIDIECLLDELQV